MKLYTVVKRHTKENEEYIDVVAVAKTMQEALESIHQETIRNKVEFSIEEIENELEHNDKFFTNYSYYTIHKVIADL